MTLALSNVNVYAPLLPMLIVPKLPVTLLPAPVPLTGAPSPATTPVTGPTGAELAPSAPILSLVNTLPATGLVPAITPLSVTEAVSLTAMGASLMMAIRKNLPATAVVTSWPSTKDTAKSSVTVDPEVAGEVNK